MEASGSGKRRDRVGHYRRAAVAHPLRRTLLLRMFEGWKPTAGEIAEAFGETPERVAHHLRILIRHGAVRAQERESGQPPLYRWSPSAFWTRKLLDDDLPGAR